MDWIETRRKRLEHKTSLLPILSDPRLNYNHTGAVLTDDLIDDL